MQVPADHTDQGIATVPQSAMTPNWIINVSDVRKQNLGIALATAFDIRAAVPDLDMSSEDLIFFLDCGMQIFSFRNFQEHHEWYLC